MTIVSSAERLNALQETHKEIQSLIDALPAQPSLASQIHTLLRSFSISHESLSDDLPPSSPLQPKLSKLAEDQRLLRASFRRTQLAVQRAAREAQYSKSAPVSSTNGDDVSHSISEPNSSDLATANPSSLPYARLPGRPRNEAANPQDLALTASSDVTAALLRTRSLLSAELEKSAFASATLEESSEALRELSQRYSVFDDVLHRSKDLVRDLVRKRKSDRWYYETAVQLLLGTLIWILIRRLVWGPVYLFIGLPVKMVYWTLFGAFKVVGLAGRGGGGSDAATAEMVEADGGMGRDNLLMSGGGKASGNWETMTTTRTEVPEPGITATMVEEVKRIIDGGETTIVRNTKSRKFEYDPSAEAQAAASTAAVINEEARGPEELAVEQERIREEVQERIRDEL